MTIRLDAADLAATRAKFDKVVSRAHKRGLNGTLELTVSDPIVTTHQDAVGMRVETVAYDVTVTGEAPRYGGWTFVARLDRTPSGVMLPMVAPGEHEPTLDGIEPGICQHCRTSRRRKTTYVVVNDAGEQRIVGSTCLRDFLGWDVTPVILTEKDLEDDIESWGSSGEPAAHTVDTVLAYAWAATKVWGFVRTTDDYALPTAMRVAALLRGGQSNDAVEARAAIAPYADQAHEKAAEIRAFILSDDFSGDSSYVSNLKALCAEDAAFEQHLGLLASAPQAHIRYLETAAEREARETRRAAEREAAAASQHIGEPGEKVEISGTIGAIRYLDGMYGTTILYTITTEQGNVVKWFASRAALGDDEGVAVHLKGTVKKHDEWQGSQSTVLTRCKPLDTA